MKPTILLSDPFSRHHLVKPILEVLDANLVLVPNVDDPSAAAHLAETQAYIGGGPRFDGALMDRMPKLKLIALVSAGFDTVDVKAAAERGIWTTNVEDYGMDEVSSHALALILACAKGLIAQTASVRAGGWNPMLNKPQKRVSESTVGVIGVGRIGTRSVAKCKGAGFRVLAHDPFISPDVIRAAGGEPVSRAQLFADSDYITLHTPLNDGTRGMIDAACFAQMKSGVFLINCSRGPVINEPALLDALNSGHVRGAALDVLVEEPPKSGTSLALVQHPKVIATPHSAFYTEQAIDFMWQSAAREAVAVLTGKTPRCPVNKPIFK